MLFVSRQYALLSTPRSGTDWFCRSIIVPSNFLYFREYFNPSALNQHRSDGTVRQEWLGKEYAFADKEVLAEAFGSEDHTRQLAKGAYGCESVYKKTWLQMNLNRPVVDKEVWSFAKVDFFHCHFNCVALYCHRKWCVMSKLAQSFYPVIFDSFVQSFEHQPTDVQNVISFAEPKNKIEKTVAGHILSNYCLLSSCMRLEIPILKYGDLVFRTRECNLPEFSCSNAVDNLERTRNLEKAVRKEKNYLGCGIEEYAKKLIDSTEKFHTCFSGIASL